MIAAGCRPFVRARSPLQVACVRPAPRTRWVPCCGADCARRWGVRQLGLQCSWMSRQLGGNQRQPTPVREGWAAPGRRAVGSHGCTAGPGTCHACCSGSPAELGAAPTCWGAAPASPPKQCCPVTRSSPSSCSRTVRVTPYACPGRRQPALVSAAWLGSWAWVRASAMRTCLRVCRSRPAAPAPLCHPATRSALAGTPT